MTLKEFVGYEQESGMEGHRKFYGDVIEKLGYENVTRCVPYDLKTLTEAFEEDKYFNNLTMKTWDLSGGFINCRNGDVSYVGSQLTSLMIRRGLNVFSNSQTVCILKECARLMVERAENINEKKVSQ